MAETWNGNQKDIELFDPLVEDTLKNYVYGLYVPGAALPFYVGKGGGKKGRGNARLTAHFDQARAGLPGDASKPAGDEGAKVSQIRLVWSEEKNVEFKIYRYGLASEDDAFQVEAALIDAFTDAGAALTNKQGGHHSGHKGLLSRSGVRALMAKPILEKDLPESFLGRPVFLFNIEKGVNTPERREREDRFVSATCEAWNLTEKWRSLPNAVALGLIRGVVWAAISIESWRQVEGVPNRWIIEHGDLTGDEYDALMFTNAKALIEGRGFWQRGNILVYEFEKTDGPLAARLLRGGLGRVEGPSPSSEAARS